LGGSSFGHSSSNRAPPTTSSTALPYPRAEQTAAAADHLVAVPDGEERFVPQIGGERNSV